MVPTNEIDGQFLLILYVLNVGALVRCQNLLCCPLRYRIIKSQRKVVRVITINVTKTFYVYYTPQFQSQLQFTLV